MKVYTKWPGLIPAIKRAGHEPVLVPEAEPLPCVGEVVAKNGLEPPPSCSVGCGGCGFDHRVERHYLTETPEEWKRRTGQ